MKGLKSFLLEHSFMVKINRLGWGGVGWWAIRFYCQPEVLSYSNFMRLFIIFFVSMKVVACVGHLILVTTKVQNLPFPN